MESHRFSGSSPSCSAAESAQRHRPRLEREATLVDLGLEEGECNYESDTFPYYYNTVAEETRADGSQEPLSSAEENERRALRMKDFHRVLGKHNVCVLPEPTTHFVDGIPSFNIFTTACFKVGARQKAKEEETQ